MKRVISVILCAVATLSLAVFPAASPVSAASSQKVELICANPGENCNTEIGISWISDFECTNCFVEFKPASESGWDNTTVVAGIYNDTDYQYFLGNSYATATAEPVFSEEHAFLNYNVTLTDLTPATRYKYRIGDGLGGYSSTHYFKTSGAKEYSFVWISDFHSYTPSSARLQAAVSAVSYAASQAEYNVDMMFSTGDTVAYGGSLNFWRQLDNMAFIKNYLYIDVNGNHDNMNNDNTNNTFNYFRITHNNPQNCYLGDSEEPYEPGVVYYFMYNDILWFVFDNETMTADIRAQVQEWAGKVIESKQGQYKYLFITEHYQWFNGNNGKNVQYSNWCDFCDKYGVDIAFSANHHVYARTHRIYKGEVVADNADVGTYYIQAPSSDCERGTSGTLENPTTYNSDIIAVNYKNAENPGKTHGTSIIDVDEDGITIRLFGSENGSGTSPAFELKDSVFISPKRGETKDDKASGDVNGDGTTNSIDASLILKYNAGIDVNGFNTANGDVNGDGTVNSIDASIILKRNAGIE